MKTKTGGIAIVGTSSEKIANLLPFADVLADIWQEPILLLGLVVVPESESLSAGTRRAQELRRALEALHLRDDTRVIVRVTYDARHEALTVIIHEKCNTVLVNGSGTIAEDSLQELPCDLIIIYGEFPEKMGRILLPIRGGPHAALALNVALAFAQARDARLSLLHATPSAQVQDEPGRELFKHLSLIPELDRTVNVHGDPVEAILEQAQPEEHQLVVMGAIARPRPGDPPVGPTAQGVLDKIQLPALIVKSKSIAEANEEAGTPVDYTISVVVDKWFAESTFQAHEFADIKQLIELKERQELTISLGLPTLNEEETIGQVVGMIRNKFVEEYPLLDEIVVIDSNSTDRTVEIAKGLGVPVVKHREVLTKYGAGQGKGEALWNSLYILRGDLIAWIDTDIVNLHPRFIYGILGPLIREPRLMYVKGFYQRPLRMGRKLQARGGGRVTELVARPLLNLFYPELSGFLQPLAGEYAGRRQALECVPFFGGYGVETGLLIDILNRFGLNAMGQVDLEERVHRNQSLEALSKMAFEVIQVVMARVGAAHDLELVNELNKSMKLVHYAADSFQLDVADIRARERPPMIGIPEYRQQRGLEPPVVQQG